MRLVAAMMALTLGGGAAQVAAQVVRLDVATLDEIERQVVMPRGAQPLGRYARHYALGVQDGRQVVAGVYLLPPVHGRAPGRRVDRWDHLPGIADGGCAQVNVLWDVARRRLVHVNCNGLA